MGWTIVHLTVTTPLFNAAAGPARDESAGGEADQAEVRVPSLRGALRFWFRALAGTVTGNDLTRLAAVEEKVFGSAQTASTLVLRIPTGFDSHPKKKRADFLPPAKDRNHPRDHNPNDRRWILYLMGQGLGDLANFRLRRSYLAPGHGFDLMLRFRHPRTRGVEEAAAVERLALASLWLTCAYGGIGARTRRGFGGISITGVDGPLAEPWTPQILRTPGLGYYQPLTHLAVPAPVAATVDRDVVCLGGTRQLVPGGERPSFPVLGQAWTSAALTDREPTAWEEVLTRTGEEFRHFRACQEYPRANYQPKIKTPEWERVVHGQGHAFPLGGLGLPVVYRKDCTVNAVDGREPARRASPLWLRVVGHGDERALFSFAFHDQFLPPRMAVRLTPDPDHKGKLTIPDGEVDRVCRHWIEGQRAGLSFLDGAHHR